MARFCPLFSGSSGNCTYIGTPEGGILIDAGVSAKRIETACWDRGIGMDSIRGDFLSPMSIPTTRPDCECCKNASAYRFSHLPGHAPD